MHPNDVRYATAVASISIISENTVLDMSPDDFKFLNGDKLWIATDRNRARRCIEAAVYGAIDFVGYQRFPAPAEFIAAAIAYFVHPINLMSACSIMEGCEFSEYIANGIERPVKGMELFAFLLHIRAGLLSRLDGAEDHIRERISQNKVALNG